MADRCLIVSYQRSGKNSKITAHFLLMLFKFSAFKKLVIVSWGRTTPWNIFAHNSSLPHPLRETPVEIESVFQTAAALRFLWVLWQFWLLCNWCNQFTQMLFPSIFSPSQFHLVTFTFIYLFGHVLGLHKTVWKSWVAGNISPLLSYVLVCLVQSL